MNKYPEPQLFGWIAGLSCPPGKHIPRDKVGEQPCSHWSKESFMHLHLLQLCCHTHHWPMGGQGCIHPGVVLLELQIIPAALTSGRDSDVKGHVDGAGGRNQNGIKSGDAGVAWGEREGRNTSRREDRQMGWWFGAV